MELSFIAFFIYIKISFFLMCMHVLSPCMAALCMCLVPQETRRGSPGTGITDDYGCHEGVRNLIQAL